MSRFGMSAKERMAMFQNKAEPAPKKPIKTGPKKVGKLGLGGKKDAAKPADKTTKEPEKKDKEIKEVKSEKIETKPAMKEEGKKEEPKKAEPKKEEAKKEEPKAAEPKKAEDKKEVKAAPGKKPEPKKPEPKKNEGKFGQLALKKVDTKKPEPKKPEPRKKEEPKKPEEKKEEPKKPEEKKEEPKKPEPKKEEPKKPEPKKEEPKKPEPKKEEPKKPEPKKEEPKKPEPKKEEPKKPEPKAPEPKKEEPKKPEPKKEEVKPAEQKKEEAKKPEVQKPAEKPKAAAPSEVKKEEKIVVKSEAPQIQDNKVQVIPTKAAPGGPQVIHVKSEAPHLADNRHQLIALAAADKLDLTAEVEANLGAKPAAGQKAQQAKPGPPAGQKAAPQAAQKAAPQVQKAAPQVQKAAPQVKVQPADADTEVTEILKTAEKPAEVKAEVIMTKSFTESKKPKQEFRPIPEDFYNTLFYFSGMGKVIGSALAEGIYVPDCQAKRAPSAEVIEDAANRKRKSMSQGRDLVISARVQANDLTDELRKLQALLENLPTFSVGSQSYTKDTTTAEKPILAHTQIIGQMDAKPEQPFTRRSRSPNPPQQQPGVPGSGLQLVGQKAADTGQGGPGWPQQVHEAPIYASQAPQAQAGRMVPHGPSTFPPPAPSTFPPPAPSTFPPPAPSTFPPPAPAPAPAAHPPHLTAPARLAPANQPVAPANVPVMKGGRPYGTQTGQAAPMHNTPWQERYGVGPVQNYKAADPFGNQGLIDSDEMKPWQKSRARAAEAKGIYRTAPTKNINAPAAPTPPSGHFADPDIESFAPYLVSSRTRSSDRQNLYEHASPYEYPISAEMEANLPYCDL